ncbi:transglycosylase domain-containing protein [Pasteuria penetrans]|uniref:transglycosylase domain-containing protein n=1 Tax=Pasteuria penetrans TaxID=86005 RepID=UPI000FB0CDB5|nr:transglycosylase domain-containing protein [Pasteuria penetrans]
MRMRGTGVFEFLHLASTKAPVHSEGRVSDRLSRMQRLAVAKADSAPSRPPRKSPQGQWGSFVKKTILLVLFTCLLLVTSGFVFLKLYINQMEPKYVKQLLGLENSSQLFDSQGQVIAPIGDVPRSYVSLDDVEKHNPELVKLFLHIEDRRFFNHFGLDPYGLLRALAKNILSMSWKEGAGTITMQVVRILSNERQTTLFRKFMEITRAVALEQKLSSMGYSRPKREILQAYLNLLNFGGGVHGVRDAARVFFGKDILKQKLSPWEVSLLVATPKAQNVYGPLSKKPEKARQRRDLVLDEAFEAGIYDREAVGDAKQKPLPEVSKKALLQHEAQSGIGLVYRDLIVKELEEDFNIDPEQMKLGGYKVYTGIRPKEQEATERALRQDHHYRADKKSVDTSKWNAASASIEPRTGLVTTIGPGRNYQNGDLITGVKEKLQWGSTLKPLSVFGPLLEKTQCGVNEYTTVEDKEIDIDGRKLKNATGGPRGVVPLSQVAAESLNLSTASLLVDKVGIDKSFSTLQDLGLPMVPKDRNVSALALGGQDWGNTALQMARAYGTIANFGVTPCPPHFVDYVIDPEGKRVKPVRDRCADQKRVFSRQSSWCLLRLLRYVNESPLGTGRKFGLGCQQPFRMKTGTTNDDQSVSVCTITPRRSTCVIVYHPDRKDKGNFGIRSSMTSFMMMQKIMEAAECGQNSVDFSPPEGVVDPVSPVEVSSLHLSATYNGHSVDLTWNPQWKGGQGTNPTYRVLRYDGGVSEVLTNHHTGTSWNDPHVEASRSYTYEVEIYAGDPSRLLRKERVTISAGPTVLEESETPSSPLGSP